MPPTPPQATPPTAPTDTRASTGNSETPTEQHLLRDVHDEEGKLKRRVELLQELGDINGGDADPTNGRRLLAEVAIQLARVQVVLELTLDELAGLTQAQITANRIKAREIRTEHLRVEHEVEQEVEQKMALSNVTAALAGFVSDLAKSPRIMAAVGSIATWIATAAWFRGCSPSELLQILHAAPPP